MISLSLILLVLAAGEGMFTTVADRAYSRENPGEGLVIELAGNVSVTDGEITVTSDSAVVWQGRGDARFYGNVVIVADTLRGTSDYLEYRREPGMVTMKGNVELTDGESVVRAQEIVYFRGSRKATAKKDVVMTGPELGFVRGEYALYDRDRGSLFVTVDPILKRAVGEDTLVVRADRLEFFPGENSAEAQGAAVVTLASKDIRSTSEYLRYFGEEDRFELLGSPLLETGDGELSGDWMEIKLDASGDPESVRIEGGASGHMVDRGTNPPAETWFDSEHAVFVLDGGAPDSIMLEGSAVLRMKGGGKAAEKMENNTVMGNVITMEFSDGELEKLTVTGSVRGTYSYLGGRR